ncbi:hypothetical protein HY837_05755 [archaeon]|nr:hypothetical protein [archaeon]
MKITNAVCASFLTLAGCAQSPKVAPEVVDLQKAVEDYQKAVNGQESVVNPLAQEFASKLEQITETSWFGEQYAENGFCGVELKKSQNGYDLTVYTHYDTWDVTYELDTNLVLHAVVNYRAGEEPVRFEVTPSEDSAYHAHQDRVNTFLKQVLGEKPRLEKYTNPLLAEHTPEDFVFDDYFLPKEVIENKNWGGRCPPGHAEFRLLTEEETKLLGGKYLLKTLGGFMPGNFYIFDEALRVVKVSDSMGMGGFGYEFKHPIKNPNDQQRFDGTQEWANRALEEILHWKAEHQKQE